MNRHTRRQEQEEPLNNNATEPGGFESGGGCSILPVARAATRSTHQATNQVSQSDHLKCGKICARRKDKSVSARAACSSVVEEDLLSGLVMDRVSNHQFVPKYVML